RAAPDAERLSHLQQYTCLPRVHLDELAHARERFLVAPGAPQPVHLAQQLGELRWPRLAPVVLRHPCPSLTRPILRDASGTRSGPVPRKQKGPGHVVRTPLTSERQARLRA